MTSVSRRFFLRQLSIAATAVLAGRHLTASAAPASYGRPFEMLVVGDSHVSGQGLIEKNKFYYLVKEWLQTDAFGRAISVNLKVKAHSGARIELHKEESELMQRLGDDPNAFHHPEANLSQPSITRQVEVAGKEYDDPGSVDLVMLSGGITDVLVANTVNPFVKETYLRERIHQYCNKSMAELLNRTTRTFPNARVVVVGYFPIISTKSNIAKIARYLFKALKFPHPLQFTLTNAASRQMLKGLRKKMADRSSLWVRESNRETRAAIEQINAKLGSRRVYFVESPITDETCFGTRRSMLWSTDKDNFPADERYGERREICTETFAKLKHHHYGKMSVRMCELAAIGHPNVEGAKAFAEAIKKCPALEYMDRLAKS